MVADKPARFDDNSEEFHAELLDNEAADDAVVAETVKRMRARGFSQEALDLAYGKPTQKAFDPNQPREPKGTSEGGRWSGGPGFDQPRSKSMREFLTKEGPQGTGRVVGFSHEGYDGVFIYTDSSKWTDDSGLSGTFRGDSEGAAIRAFRRLVRPAEKAEEAFDKAKAECCVYVGDEKVFEGSCKACDAYSEQLQAEDPDADIRVEEKPDDEY